MRIEVLKVLSDINPMVLAYQDTDLISGKIIDSFDIAKILSALEKKFSIDFDPKEISVHNFSTVSAMVKLVEKKLQEVDSRNGQRVSN